MRNLKKKLTFFAVLIEKHPRLSSKKDQIVLDITGAF